MGALTRSKLDRAVVARYFSFLIISQLIIFTLIGVIFSEPLCPFHVLDGGSHEDRFGSANCHSNWKKG
jgi:hypothetical protein